jgi:hypothetical protein
MRSPRTTRHALTALAALLAAACSDAPQQHSQFAPQAPALASGVLPVVEQAVYRRVPLAKDMTASLLVGSNGGRLEIPAAGLRVDVPSNALPRGSAPVMLKVTAYAGSQIAYDFEPSGTKFVQPLRFQQDLNFLALNPSLLGTQLPSISYFKTRSDLDASTGTVRTYESLLTSFDLSGHTVKADIWHFSGYVVAWGRNGRDDGQ